MKILETISSIILVSLISFLVSAEQILPAEFTTNRITLVPKLQDGKELRFYTDTGGGWNAISRELQQQYAWPEIKKTFDGKEFILTEMPEFQESSFIPLGGIQNLMEGHLFIAAKEKLQVGEPVDGFLGGRWHAEKIIRFDYPNKSMSILESLEEINLTGFEKLKLGFQKDSDNKYTTAFARMEVTVLGRKFQMLFDTGATSTLTETAMQQMKSSSKYIGTSFIIASVFDEWREKNPNWLVIDGGEAGIGHSLIQVPTITIAGQDVGPVWFTRREDYNFHGYMSAMMDKKIDGAIGGSGFQYFEIVVDYIGESAYFKAATKPAI